MRFPSRHFLYDPVEFLSTGLVQATSSQHAEVAFLCPSNKVGPTPLDNRPCSTEPAAILSIYGLSTGYLRR